MIRIYSREKKKSRVGSIPVTRRGSVQWRCTHYFRLPTLAKGDIVQFNFSPHLTNNLPYTVVPVPEVRLSPSAGNGQDGKNIWDPGGDNLSRKRHHQDLLVAGQFTADKGYDRPYCKLIVHVKSTAAQPRDRVKVDRGLSPASVLVIRR